jgi:hypothetical protein
MDGLQLYVHVVQPTLALLAGAGIPNTRAAEALILATAAHESGGFHAIDQVTRPDDITAGPARGLWQIEPSTHADLYLNYLRFRPTLMAALESFLAAAPDRDQQLATNLAYGCAVARLLYHRRRVVLPATADPQALGREWKRLFNTAKGKGTLAQFSAAYERHVAPVFRAYDRALARLAV